MIRLEDADEIRFRYDSKVRDGDTLVLRGWIEVEVVVPVAEGQLGGLAAIQSGDLIAVLQIDSRIHIKKLTDASNNLKGGGDYHD